MNRFIFALGCFLIASLAPAEAEGTNKTPLRFAIYGLVHDHARGFIPGLLTHTNAQLVGIIEPDRELAARYAKLYKLDTKLFHSTLSDLLAVTNVQAVATFTSTFDHLKVVEECAPRGIHVMVEKPLAVNMKQAKAMKAAAEKGGIQLIVNYETTWYPGNQVAYKMVCEQSDIGEIRKIVVHDGHQGPKEIGCSTDFLKWLTDPVLNGGGALMDFGCYGADLMTWLMQGQRPTSVFAVTQQIKPDVYPKVEDEGTIVLSYPKAQGIIQASWNWPYNRKDMEIYGQRGYVIVPRSNLLRVLKGGNVNDETAITPEPLTGAQADPLSYLAGVVRGDFKPSGLSSLDVNMVVMEILDAARESARTGKRIELGAKP